MATKYTWTPGEQNNQKVLISHPHHFFIKQSSKGTRLFRYDTKADGGYVACGSYSGLREAKQRAEDLHKEISNTWEGMMTVDWDLWHVHHDTDGIQPSPNYVYQVGDKVQYGSQPDAQVEEIHNGGQVLVISVADRGESYGVPYDNNRKLPHIVYWNNVNPMKDVTPTNFATKRKETQYSQTSLDGLVHTCYRRGLIDSPIYQRGYVWTLEDKQRLVKSIFNRADIGKFVLMQHPYPENRLEVIDGKQRLNAIREFVEGRFEYEGKTWFQLSYNDKRSFYDIMVQTCQLESDRIKKSDVLWLFLSVNAAGVPQTEEHISKVRELYEKTLAEEKA
jgi:hypothetical protein